MMTRRPFGLSFPSIRSTASTSLRPRMEVREGEGKGERERGGRGGEGERGEGERGEVYITVPICRKRTRSIATSISQSTI